MKVTNTDIDELRGKSKEELEHEQLVHEVVKTRLESKKLKLVYKTPQFWFSLIPTLIIVVQFFNNQMASLEAEKKLTQSQENHRKEKERLQEEKKNFNELNTKFEYKLKQALEAQKSVWATNITLNRDLEERILKTSDELQKLQEEKSKLLAEREKFIRDREKAESDRETILNVLKSNQQSIEELATVTSKWKGNINTDLKWKIGKIFKNRTDSITDSNSYIVGKYGDVQHLLAKPKWEFAKYPKVKYLDYSEGDLRSGELKASLKSLRSFPNVSELDLGGSKLNDLNDLKNLPLKKIYLNSAEVKDYSALKNLTQLEVLFLAWSDIKSLEPLKNLKNLKELSLSSTDISDFKVLENLKGLEKLQLEHTKFSDLNILKHLPKLEYLNISGAKVSKEQIKEFRKDTGIKFHIVD